MKVSTSEEIPTQTELLKMALESEISWMVRFYAVILLIT